MTELETIREQLDKVLTALKLEHELSRNIDGLERHKELDPNCPTCQLISDTEAQIAGESVVSHETAIHETQISLTLTGETQISPRVQIIRRAKAIIEALNLPEDGGVAMDFSGHWLWSALKPGFYNEHKRGWLLSSPCGSLPLFSLSNWPGDWHESWITRTTEEV